MKLMGDGRFGFQVVGESYHQHALADIAGDPERAGHHTRCDATLRVQPDNPYDSHAVAVLIAGREVGFVPRHMAGEMFNLIADDVECTADAMIVGGWDRGGGDTGYYGVRLDIVRPFELSRSPRKRLALPQNLALPITPRRRPFPALRLAMIIVVIVLAIELLRR